MLGILRFLAVLCVICGASLLPASAQDLPLGAFFGSFKGGGVAENRDSLYFGITVRDLDVTIQPEGQGFKVDWATIIRSGGDPNNPNIKRKAQSATFLATDKPGVYRATGFADPLQGGKYTWARIKKQTLYVYALLIGDDGRYDMQMYERTIKPSGMDLVFHRIRDGEPVRTVKGKLIKYSN